MPKITNLRATAITSSTIACAWHNCSVLEAVRLRGTDLLSGALFDSALAAGSESGTLSNLLPSRLYAMTVRVGSEESDPIFVTTEAGGSAPDAPSGVVGTMVSASRIDWSFTDNSSNEDGFEVEVWDTLAERRVFATTIAANLTTITTDGLASARLYGMRVRATNATFGPSDWSDFGYSYTRIWDQRPIGGSGTISPPNFGPANLHVVAAETTETSAHVAWDYYGVSHDYFVAVLLNSAGTQIRASQRLAASARDFVWTGLTAGTTYQCYVTACNEGGCTPSENTLTFRTRSPIPDPPIPPVNFSAAEIGPGHVLCQLDASATGGDTVSIWRDTVPSTSATELVSDLSPLATSYIDDDPGLGAGNTYRYWATATNIAGTSDPSDTDDVTITAAVDILIPPYGHELQPIDSTHLLATWQQEGAFHNAFKLEISDTSDTGPWVTVSDTIQPFDRRYTISGLTADTEYWTQVRAITTGIAESDPSNVANATTYDDLILAAPTGPVIDSVEVSGASAAQVRWHPTEVRVAYYSVRISVAGAAYSVYATNIDPSVLVQDIVGLDSGTSHRVVVRAHSDGGTGDSDAETFVTGPRGHGPGEQGRFRAIKQFAKRITKDDDDVLVSQIAGRKSRILFFRSAPPDATNGPFAELYVDGVLAAAAGGDAGVATVSNRYVAAGGAVEVRVRGTGTEFGKMVLAIEAL